MKQGDVGRPDRNYISVIPSYIQYFNPSPYGVQDRGKREEPKTLKIHSGCDTQNHFMVQCERLWFWLGSDSPRSVTGIAWASV